MAILYAIPQDTTVQDYSGTRRNQIKSAGMLSTTRALLLDNLLLDPCIEESFIAALAASVKTKAPFTWIKDDPSTRIILR